MSWLSELFRTSVQDGFRSEAEIFADPSAWTIWGLGDAIGGRKPAAGVDVDYNTAMNCAAAIACTRAIAETVSTLPALLYEQVAIDARQKARSNRMWRLLHDEPNPHMDSRVFYSLMTKRLVNRGNAFAFKEYNERQRLVALWPIHNSRVRAFRSQAQMMPSGRYDSGRIVYRLYLNDAKPNEYHEVDQSQVLNICGFDTEDGILATGVIPRAKQEIALEIAEQEFTASVYGNGAMPMGLVKHPGFIVDETKRATFRRDINAIHGGRENWNKIGVLWENAEWQKLGFSPDEVKALDSRNLSSKQICKYYNVPPAIIQIFDDFKFSTVEAMLKHFIMLCIRPYAVCWERAIGMQVLSELNEGLLMEFALEGLLRGDPETQARANAILRTWGVLNADEWRAQFNWNPLPDGLGQHYIMPMNHTTIDRVVNGEALNVGRSTTSGGEGGRTARGVTESPDFRKEWLAALMIATEGQRPGSRVERIQIPVSTREVKSSKRLRGYARQVLDEAVSRMVAIEIQKANKAAVQGGSQFGAWLDRFYETFPATFAKATTIGVMGIVRAGLPKNRWQDLTCLIDTLAAMHCEESKSRLLAAAECQPEELVGRIEAETSTWSQRRLDVRAARKRREACTPN